MAGKVRRFVDFAQASGGITCTNNLYITGEQTIYIRAGTDDAAGSPKAPCIEIKFDDQEADPPVQSTINMYVETNQQDITEYIRPRVDAGSGLMPVSVCSGMFYGWMTSATSGVPINTAALGVVPWEASSMPDDVHFAHDPTDAAHNTHVTVLLDGWYTITYHITGVKAGGGATTTIYSVGHLNDTVILPGSQSLAACLVASAGGTCSWRGTVYLNAGDNVSVACREFATAANNAVLLGNYCSLHIKYEGPTL